MAPGLLDAGKCTMRSLATLTLPLLSLVPALAACESDLTLENARPAVTWVEATPIDASRTALSLWLKDAEGEAVDVEVIWSAGGQGAELALAPGSAPLLGLPTELGLGTAEGQHHRVTWDLTGVPTGAVTLTFTVDDDPYEAPAGDTYTVILDPRSATGPLAASRVSLRD